MITTGVVTFSASGIQVICNLTITTTIIVARFAKVIARRSPEALIGQSTGTEARRCTDNLGGGNDVIRLLNPVRERYDIFLGTLPRVTGVLVTYLELEILVLDTDLGISCLYRGDVPFLYFENGGGQTFDHVMFLPSTGLPLHMGPADCPGPLVFSGTQAISSPIRVRLI
jgi:hypothetical protein